MSEKTCGFDCHKTGQLSDCGLRGKPLFDHIMETIEKNRKLWNQKQYHSPKKCGTAHCIAGWAQILTGNKERDWNAWNDGRRVLELEYEDAEGMFFCDATLTKIKKVAKRAYSKEKTNGKE